MNWLIIFVISSITFIIGIKKDKENVLITSFIFGIFSFIISVAAINSGITDYPYLLKEKERIAMLEKGIEDIRQSVYISKEKTESMVSGDIANFKQSTVLSEYIGEVYKAKSDFNAYLQQAQYYEKSTLMNIISDGFFISSQIHNIEKFK